MRILLLLLPFLMTAVLNAANITVNPYFQSHMVLQRNKPILVWGNAKPGVEFSVSLGTENKRVEADRFGKWVVEFKEHKASFTPLTLKVDNILFEDILIGDVWLCSGQSNMVFPIRNGDVKTKDLSEYERELSQIRVLSYKGLRLVAKNGYTDSELKRSNKDDFFYLKWNNATVKTLQDFSAVATHFGLNIVQNVDVPIGLIQCAIGGSAINNWIPEQVLRSNQFTSDWFTSDWLKNNKISLAHRKRGKEVFKNILPVGGEYIIDNMKYHFLCEPSFLFEASFAKIRNINLKGVLWYQGEADSESDEAIVVYSDFYKMLVDSWRRNFNDSKLLFVSIQLPSYKAEKWPEMRYAQYMSIKSNKYCYIVPTIDLGDYKNIHYNGKKEVGKRAAFVALDNVYGKEVCSIPEYNDYKITDNALTISFKDIGNGLNVSKGKNQVPIILHYNDGINEIVNATLNANSELIVPINREVQSLYYAWKPYLMETPLLLSKDGIPVLPFKIDF